VFIAWTNLSKLRIRWKTEVKSGDRTDCQLGIGGDQALRFALPIVFLSHARCPLRPVFAACTG